MLYFWKSWVPFHCHLVKFYSYWNSYACFECLVAWGCRIDKPNLWKGTTSSLTNVCPRSHTEQSDSEVPIMLERWGTQSTPSLESRQVTLWPGVVAPDRVLSMGQKELNCVLMLNWIARKRTVLKFKLHTYAKLICLKLKWFWHSIVRKQKIYLY